MSADNTLNESQRGSEPPVTEQPANPTKESFPRPSTPDPLPQDRKLYAGRPNEPDSELTKAKEKWLQLSEPEQDHWHKLLLSRAKLPVVRERLREAFHVNLDGKDQVQRFRKWIRKQRDNRRHAKRLKEREEKIMELHRDWPLDRVREEVLKYSYKWSMKRKQFQLAMQTINAHCRTDIVELSERRLEDSKRSDEEKALAICIEEAKNFPEVMALFREAFAALEKAQAAK